MAAEVAVKLLADLTKGECLEWLRLNDPEFDWASHGSPLDAGALQDAIADNLYDFGEKAQTGRYHVLLNELSIDDPHRGRVA